MDIAGVGFELGASARVLILTATTVIILGSITAIARRRHSYWWLPIAFIIASCASLALGSIFAVQTFMGLFEGMSRAGGGISTVWFGISQATQPALAAAWLAVLTNLLASVFVVTHTRKGSASLAGAQRPRAAIFASVVVCALAIGVMPVMLFQRAAAFVLWVITPPAHVNSISQAIATRLLVTATVNACCFAVLVALVVMTVLLARKSSSSRPLLVITVFALVVSLGLSAALVANLRSFSNRYRTAALTGQMPSE